MVMTLPAYVAGASSLLEFWSMTARNKASECTLSNTTTGIFDFAGGSTEAHGVTFHLSATLSELAGPVDIDPPACGNPSGPGAGWGSQFGKTYEHPITHELWRSTGNTSPHFRIFSPSVGKLSMSSGIAFLRSYSLPAEATQLFARTGFFVTSDSTRVAGTDGDYFKVFSASLGFTGASPGTLAQSNTNLLLYGSPYFGRPSLDESLYVAMASGYINVVDVSKNFLVGAIPYARGSTAVSSMKDFVRMHDRDEFWLVTDTATHTVVRFKIEPAP
jgi:hypothetical protein